MVGWPRDAAGLVEVQRALGRAAAPRWQRPAGPLRVGACFVCFDRHPAGRVQGAGPELGWAAAAVASGRRLLAVATVSGPAAAPYRPAQLALREGPLLDAAVRALAVPPDVLIVNATGRDHPRRAGLALHLGAVLGLPTVGVSNRPLSAEGAWPADERGATAPLLLDGELVGYWLRTRPGARPLAVHAAWRTTPEDAVTIVLAAIRRARTPFPLRRARQAARTARSAGRHRPIGTIGLDAASASPWAGASKVVLPGDLPIVRRSVVRLVVLDASGRLLLFHTRDPHHPELGTWWELPGGGIDHGETYREAAIRELREETGIAVTASQLGSPRWRRRASFRHRGTRRLQDEVVVAVRLDGPGPDVDGSERLDYEQEDYFDFRWWPVDEVVGSQERFYPGRLPALLGAFLAGEQIDEPFELWS
jgi:deoxyinosine 3'endonuclease (endonuclease V)/8-oxo-dGTP pyrophosphatase MutT (NUDIX family)